MWLRLLVITILFYLFYLIQNSFFVHFNVLGATPNFILIFYFILIFFSSHDRFYSWEDLFYSVVAGILLDIFSYSHFGVSFALLLIISLIIKKLFNSLKQRKDKHPIVYFVPLFFISLIIYDVLLGACLYFFSAGGGSVGSWDISWTFLIKIIYSCIFAVIGFYITRRLQK